MSKGGFPFASADFIPTLMKGFEEDFLFKYTPCDFASEADIIYALGVVHVELIIIHPFREGNGRTARLLTELMALQSGLLLLDFSKINQISNPKGYNEYITSIHAAFDRNYKPIQHLFGCLIKKIN